MASYARRLHELWMMDSSDFSLRKTKMRHQHFPRVGHDHLPSKKIKDYTYMREYQNYLFFFYWTGMRAFIFTAAWGNLIKTIGEKT